MERSRIDNAAPCRADCVMHTVFPILGSCAAALFFSMSTGQGHAQLVAFDGFNGYAAGAQLESGNNGSQGTGLDGGVGWGAPYDANNSIKSLIRIENRSANPVTYSSGDITLYGGNLALRFYDIANGSFAFQRPLGVSFSAAAGDVLWFSILFRTSSSSPLANLDFFQVGFDDNADAASGVPRVSVGAGASQSTFPSPFRFFARSSAAPSGSVFHNGLEVAASTTYLLVGRIQPHAGSYDTVSLFVNPDALSPPATPSAEVILASGVSTLSHAFVRTAGLDSGDILVFDEWSIGRDYASVIPVLQRSLRVVSPTSPDSRGTLSWPVSLTGATLQTSTTLAPESWEPVSGPLSPNGTEWTYLIPAEPGVKQRFFRLSR